MDEKTLFIELGSPREKEHIESINEKQRDEVLVREIFSKLLETKGLIEPRRWGYNRIRPHSALVGRWPSSTGDASDV